MAGPLNSSFGGPTGVRRRSRCLAPLVSLVFVSVVVTWFAIFCFRWEKKWNRPMHHAIVPRLRPCFHYVNMSDPEYPGVPYYQVFRFLDWGINPHLCQVDIPRRGVPSLYVHGNAGSFFDARSFGHYLNLQHVAMRRQQVQNFDFDVKRSAFAALVRDGVLRPGRRGRDATVDSTRPEQTIDWRRELERAREVRLEATALLPPELFALDFLGESNTQSGVLLVREARFLCQALHVLMRDFRAAYADILGEPSGSREAGLPLPASVEHVKKGYLEDMCTVGMPPYSQEGCAHAQKCLSEWPLTDMIRREVQRVTESGMWLLSESMGGAVTAIAALLQPELFAGVVMIGSPIRYPPLLFDSNVISIHKAIHIALLTGPSVSNERQPFDWDSAIHTASKSSSAFVDLLAAAPDDVLRQRLENIPILMVNGGSLDDIIPLKSSSLSRQTHWGPGSSSLMPSTCSSTAIRRDVSSEELRNCGIALDHGALVYAAQLLIPLSGSLLQASLLPHAGRFLENELSTSFEDTQRAHLFAPIVETLPPGILEYQASEDLFVRALDESSLSGEAEDPASKPFDLDRGRRLLAEEQVTVCALGSPLDEDSIDIATFALTDEEDDTLFYGTGKLDVLWGYTTLPAHAVRNPTIRLFASQDYEREVAGLVTIAVSILHLPTVRRDGGPVEGRSLQAAVSFEVRGDSELARTDLVGSTRVWPQFCFDVSVVEQPMVHRHFWQHHVIHPRRPSEVAKLETFAGIAGGNRWLGALLGALRSGPTIEKSHRHAIVYNIDLLTMETGLTVSFDESGAEVDAQWVTPYVICGSLHSLRIAVRGVRGLPNGNPESQLQHFFGPNTRERLPSYSHSWRPHPTIPFNSTEPYVVLVLAGREKAVELHLNDLERLSQPFDVTWENIGWLASYCGLRWMAYFAEFSLIGRYGSSYSLLFVTMYLLMGRVGFRLQRCGTEWMVYPNAFLRRLHVVKPIVAGVLFEYASSVAVRWLLPSCFEGIVPDAVDAGDVAPPSLLEQVSLMFLMGLPPRLRECQYSWVRFLSTSPPAAQLEHSIHVIGGCTVAVAAITIMYALYRVLGAVVSYLVRVRCHIRKYVFGKPYSSPLVRWHSRATALSLWLLPIAVLLGLSWVHVSIATTISAIVGLGVLGSSTLAVASSQRYLVDNVRWTCFFILFAALCTAHFEGLALVIRNYVMLPIWIMVDEAERQEVDLIAGCTFAMVQLSQGILFVTLDIFHLPPTDPKSPSVPSRPGATDPTPQAAPQNPVEQQALRPVGYLTGRYPWFRRTVTWTRQLSLAVVVWLTLVAIRSPIDATISMIAAIFVMAHLSATVMQDASG